MRIAVFLFAYAALLGWVCDAQLARLQRTAVSPRVTIWLWHALALAVLTSVTGGLMVLAHDVWEHGLAWLLHADKARVHAAYEGPSEVPGLWNGALLLLVAMVLALGLTTLRRVQAARVVACRHRIMAHASDRPHRISSTRTSYAIVDHPAPLIYCLPGRRSADQIIVTTGARDRLTSEQLAAAVEHEYAHVRGRHHAMVLTADVVAQVLRWTRWLRHYPSSIRTLVELAADDHAARRHGRRKVATALLEMSATSQATPPFSLGIAGADAGTRILRLVDGHHREPAPAIAWLLIGVAAIVVLTPVAAVTLPAAGLPGSAHAAEVWKPGTVRSDGTPFTHHP
jgi:Zn-dependent protease with chaperone function